MKKLFGKVVFGIAMGCSAFVSMLFIASAIAGGGNAFIGKIMTGEELLRTALCFIILSTGFSVPSLIYEKENLANGLKVFIQMAAGTAIFLVVSFIGGWFEKTPGSAAIYILIALGTAAVIWAVYMLAFKIQADKINRKIKEMQDWTNQ